MSSFNESESYDAIIAVSGTVITMQSSVVRAAVSILNAFDIQPTTPGAVYDALLDLCGDWYSDLAQEYQSEGSVAYEDEAAFDKAEAALNALQAALPKSEKGADDGAEYLAHVADEANYAAHAIDEQEHGLQGRGPDAPVDLYTVNNELVPF